MTSSLHTVEHDVFGLKHDVRDIRSRKVRTCAQNVLNPARRRFDFFTVLAARLTQSTVLKSDGGAILDATTANPTDDSKLRGTGELGLETVYA